MALPKYSGLKLGPGAFNEKSLESQVYIEPAVPRNGTVGIIAWNTGTSYNTGAPVLYDNISYNSLTSGNVGNQPDISPSDWVQVDGKDGDIWIQVPAAGYPAGGADTEMYIKNNTVWRPFSGANPIKVFLNDGQIAEDSAIEFPAGLFPYCELVYTVKRGAGDNIKRAGKFIILNDGGSVNYSHEFNEIGIDVLVPFSVDLSTGNVRLRYTSALQGNTIELRYNLKGWI
jgi:hypothetical protein